MDDTIEIAGVILSQLMVNGLAALVWVKILARLDPALGAKGRRQRLPRFFLAGLAAGPLAIMVSIGTGYAIRPLFTESETVNFFVDQFFTSGFSEELCKFFVFFVITKKLNSIIEPLDGVVQACTLALGFSVMENFLYGIIGGLSLTLFRSLVCTIGHMTYSFLWSAAYSLIIFGAKKEERKEYGFAMVMGVFPAALLHGLYNFFLDVNRLDLAGAVDLISLIAAMAILNELKKRTPYTPHTKWDYQKSNSLVKQALVHHPEDFELNYRAGANCLYKKDYERAALHFNLCYRKKPGHAKTALYFAMALTGIRSYHEAIQVFEKRFNKVDYDEYPKLVREIRKFKPPCWLIRDMGLLFDGLDVVTNYSR